MKEKYICDHARDDCDGCFHAKPHYNFYANANRCCTDEAFCSFHEIKTVCVISKNYSDKIDSLSLLPDISMIEHVGKCECLIHQVANTPKPDAPATEYFKDCPNCLGTREITRPATLGECIEGLIELLRLFSVNLPSGGILRIKEGKG